MISNDSSHQSSSNGLKPNLSPSDLSRYLQAAFQACDGASSILSNHFGHLRNLEEKHQAGLVSDADRESEKFIRDHLLKTFPDHSILGEEAGLSGPTMDGSSGIQSKALWIIDPLDGTTNFVHQFPVFCISIGLEIDGKMVVGVVDAPKLGLRFHAILGGGAFVNGEPIHASHRARIEDALFATGFFGHDAALDEQLELVGTVIRKSRGIRRAGAAALDMCFVAQGIFDVFWEKNLSPWDTAAGTIIAQEAGAVVTDMQGAEYNPRLKSVLCGNPILHRQSLELIKEIHQRFSRT